MRKYAPLLIFIVLATVGIFHHEIWTDEAHPWVIVRDSSFLEWRDIFARDGHSVLWPVLVKLAQVIYPDPFSMQILSLLLGITSFFILWKYSPWGTLEKVLLSLNYFLLFEFTVIARNYALEVLILFILCALWSRRFERPLLFLFFTLLLPLTHILAGIFGAGFIIAAFQILYRKHDKILWVKAGGIFLVFFIVYFWSAQRPDDAIPISFDLLFNFKDFGRRSYNFLYAFFIVLRPYKSFWTNPLLSANATTYLLAPILLTGLLVSLVLAFRKSLNVLILFILGMIPLVTFYYMSTSPFYRHSGHLWLLFVVCTWLLNAEKIHSGKIIRATFLFTLVTGAYSGLTALAIDYQHPFSQGKNVAGALKNFPLSDYDLISEFTLFTSSFEAHHPFPYLDNEGKKVTFSKTTLDQFRLNSSVDQVSGLQHALRLPGSDMALRKKLILGQKKLLLMTMSPAPEEILQQFRLKEVAKFTDALVFMDQFYLYSQ